MSVRNIGKTLQRKKILVTGADGFLGSYLVPELRAVCDTVDIYQKDIMQMHRLKQHYDMVCHLAGFTKADMHAGLEPLFDVNVNGTLALMGYCAKHNARCILASSSAVYAPLRAKKLLPEQFARQPVAPYGVSKMMSEMICQYYAKEFGVSTTILRIFNMYGAGQSMPFLIPYLINHLKGHKPLVVETPHAVRDFVYVSDVAKAFVAACTYQHRGVTAFNVGTGCGMSVRVLTQRIADYLNVQPRIDGKQAASSKREYVVADTLRIRRLLGWQPQISFNKSLTYLYKKGD